MEFVWRPMYGTLGSDVQIFTHALYAHYSAPSGFDFDMLSNDDPFVVDKDLETYNAPEKSADFLQHILTRRQYYKTNDLLIVMGDDFRF